MKLTKLQLIARNLELRQRGFYTLKDLKNLENAKQKNKHKTIKGAKLK